jgi:Uma2 family endonuclease
MSANPLPRLTGDAYLAMDRAAEWKSEFHDGEMFPIEAVSLRHARILMNLMRATDPGLRLKSCEGLPGPLRVRVSATQYVYPDFQIVCGKPELTDENDDTVINPKVVIEILSPSTAGYDHSAKFELYRRLASLEEYVLVSQAKQIVEVFTKQSERLWSLAIVEGEDQNVCLQSVGIEFPLASLYDGLDSA